MVRAGQSWRVLVGNPERDGGKGTYLFKLLFTGYSSEFVVLVDGEVMRGSNSISLLSASRKERSMSSPTVPASSMDLLSEALLASLIEVWSSFCPLAPSSAFP